MNALTENVEGLLDKSVLRFITAGSVDDGKSTLIGRLLFDGKGVYADQLRAIGRSRYNAIPDQEFDLALLTDGLEAEREQGITIDVAYRYFATPARTFIVADAPGHEQYTRNMVTGASTADAAIILIDATKASDGTLLVQTRRHSAIAKLLGIRHIVVAINKLDLLDWSEDVYQRIAASYDALAKELGITAVQVVPVSALKGDNIARRSQNMPWYRGPTLLQILESIDTRSHRGGAADDPVRFSVQRVVRQHGNALSPFRGYAGQLISGALAVGDTVLVQPGNTVASIKKIITYDGVLERVGSGVPVTLELNQDVDITRGDILTQVHNPAQARREFTADVCWLDAQPLNLKRKYAIKHGARLSRATIKQIDSVRDVHKLTPERNANQNGDGQTAPPGLDRLAMNDIARVIVATQDVLPIDDYDVLPANGAFILIDEVTHQTVAAGMIRIGG